MTEQGSHGVDDEERSRAENSPDGGGGGGGGGNRVEVAAVVEAWTALAL